MLTMTDTDRKLAHKVADCIVAQNRPCPSRLLWHNEETGEWKSESVRPGSDWVPHLGCWENVGPLLALVWLSPMIQNIQIEKPVRGEPYVGWQASCELSLLGPVRYWADHPAIALARLWLCLQGKEANDSK